MKTIGAYIANITVSHWTTEDAREQFQLLQSYGVNTIFSEADTYSQQVIDVAHDLGLRFMGGLTCFHNNKIVEKHPEYHPITADGQPRPQMNWYIGITPTHESYRQQRLDVLKKMLADYQLDGIWLDFIRWSMHWEVELRDDTPPPLETSFDPHTLTLFSEWSGLKLPETDRANWIRQHHRDQWTDFKCHVITEFVKQVNDILEQHNPTIPLGVNIVPANSIERRQLLGQDVEALSEYTDVFSPMVYHHILGHEPAWIRDTLDNISDKTGRRLIPFVQVSALNADQENFSSKEWEQVVRTVLDHPQTDGLIAFTGPRLHSYDRGQDLGRLVL